MLSDIQKYLLKKEYKKSSFICHLDIHFYDLKNSKLSCQIDGKKQTLEMFEKQSLTKKDVHVVCEN